MLMIIIHKPIQALKHPRFKEMVDVASRATQGIKIPGRKATQAEIMRMFMNHLTQLKKTLNSASVRQSLIEYASYQERSSRLPQDLEFKWDNG
ncbi:hypothetical protein BDR03DRAFT_1018576 [Suillus americanus]|nr:hypothetical protein BDR03DRAFT_1018576 [Suillus americanus]